MTASEKRLWDILKRKQILDLRFRPQHPIDVFIADFYCHPLKLVIEVDGGIHIRKEQMEHDIGREIEINSYGIKVIRFTNDEIEKNLDYVKQTIIVVCKERIAELKSPL